MNKPICTSSQRENWTFEPHMKGRMGMLKVFVMAFLFAVFAQVAVAGRAAVFDVRDFGAKGDGIAKDTASVQRALDDCAAAGGGRVVVPPGTYVIGSVFLGDGTDLHLEAGAVLLGSPDLADYNADDAYPQNHGSKHEGWSAKHLVLAIGKERVSITGCGTIDGNARAFFADKPRWAGAICWRDGAINARDAEHQGRPGQEIVFIESKDVVVRDVTLRDMACWSCFFHGCENVTVGGVTVRNDLRYLNTDGFDVDSCRNVSIGDCRITTGDDAIAIRGSPARLTDPSRVCENVRVSNVVCRVSADGVRVGVGDGEIRNVRVSDMTILRAGRGLHVQSCYGANPKKGVDISDVVFSRIRIRDAVTPILIGSGSTNCKAQIRGIRFEDVDAEALAPVTVVGGGIARPSGISFANLRFRVLPSSKPIPPDAEAGKLSDAEPAAFRLQGSGSVSFENSVLSWDPEVQAGFRKAFSVIDAEQPSVDVNSRIADRGN